MTDTVLAGHEQHCRWNLQCCHSAVMSSERNHIHRLADFVSGSLADAIEQPLVEYGGRTVPDLLHPERLRPCQE
jgi:hypothetical protein